MSTPLSRSSVRSSRRVRTNSVRSNLFGMETMMMMGSPLHPSVEEGLAHPKSNVRSMTTYSLTDRDQLVHLTRTLRRTKHRLLLKSVEQPLTPVDKLRSILLQVVLDTMNEDDGNSHDIDSCDASFASYETDDMSNDSY